MKFHDLRGMRILNVADARELGTVDDVFLHLDEQQVLALRIKTGGLFGGHKALLLPDVKAIGKDAVTVESDDKLSEEDKVSALQGAAKRGAVEGLDVVSENGSHVGTVDDFDADFSSGAISGYVLKGGLGERLQHVERLVPASTVKSISDKAMVVTDPPA